jgi:HD-like signal output (HDOD) protein
MAFVASGAEALALMEKQPFDVIVSDMRMPQMDGVSLLGSVMVKYPQTIRFVLSGHSDRELIMQSMGSTHQYLSKPCDADMLLNTISRAFALRSVLQKESLKRVITQIKSLPALPDLFLKVMQELKSPDASAQKVGEIISRDIAMSAKVLQLVNSAFFGLPNTVKSPSHAVSLLGLDVVKSLVLMVQVFSQTHAPKVRGFSMDRLWEHSLLVGQCAQAIMRKVGPDKKMADDAFMAGLLHDIGKLILAADLPEAFESVTILTEKDNLCLLDAERRILDATHGEVGGYLMGLWGFPDPVIEACIYHYRPQECPTERFSSLGAVHVANAYVNRFHPDGVSPSAGEINMEFLRRLNMEEQVTEWESLCRDICGCGREGKSHE